jgi:hypothetical protein
MILYTAELDLPTADLDAFAAWYAGRHAPDLYRAGFQVCTSYRAVEGDMNVLNLYQLPSWEIFESPLYRAIGPKDAYGNAVTAGARDKANTPYSLQLTLPTPANSASGIDADWISIVRYAAAPDIDRAIAESLIGGEAERLFAEGAKRVHCAHRERPHPQAASQRPRSVIVVEWPEPPPNDEASAPGRTQRFREQLTEISTFIGYRVYPWPDRVRP